MSGVLEQSTSRVQQVAQQLALAALDETNANASALSQEAVTEIKHLHSLATKTLESIKLLGTAVQLKEAKAEVIAAIQAQTAAANKAARVQALQNALAIVDKASVTSGHEYTPQVGYTDEGTKEVNAEQVRNLLTRLLLLFLEGGDMVIISAKYSVNNGRAQGSYSFSKAEFDKGQQAFQAALAQNVQSLTGMPTTAKSVAGNKFTITITPP